MHPSKNGRPSYPPQVLSTVVVLQVLNGLSDVETVLELCRDLRQVMAATCACLRRRRPFDQLIARRRPRRPHRCGGRGRQDAKRRRPSATVSAMVPTALRFRTLSPGLVFAVAARKAGASTAG
ncbi:transposase [Streptomyces sp. NBC_00212]|uniref:transposase n=1 Tax=Streptomyces sp. NBC_00212 TaxID=2975684 RepID=UPI00324A76E3